MFCNREGVVSRLIKSRSCRTLEHFRKIKYLFVYYKEHYSTLQNITLYNTICHNSPRTWLTYHRLTRLYTPWQRLLDMLLYKDNINLTLFRRSNTWLKQKSSENTRDYPKALNHIGSGEVLGLYKYSLSKAIDTWNITHPIMLVQH